MKNLVYTFLVVVLSISLGNSQTISLTAIDLPATENFNTLSNSSSSSTVPNGWYFSETGSNADNLYFPSTGSSTSGDTYSFGVLNAVDRAFGGVLSGSLTTTIGARITNNTGSTAPSIYIQYTGEQWRLGALAREDRLEFQYSINATSLTTGTWTSNTSGNFVAPTTTGSVGLLDGNLSTNRLQISFLLGGLNIANGASIWIRWNDYNAAGADDGLGIDDVSIAAVTALPLNWLTFTGNKLAGGDLLLEWTTANEVDVHHFEIENSADGNTFMQIGKEPAKNQSFNGYSYTVKPGLGTAFGPYYRLKEVDNNGTVNYSQTLAMKGNTGVLISVYPNPVSNTLYVRQLPDVNSSTFTILNVSGQVIQQGRMEVSRDLEGTIDIQQLTPGTYFLQIEGSDAPVQFIKN